MGVVVVIEDMDIEKFKDRMQNELNKFYKEERVNVDVKFSTCKLHDGDKNNDGVLYSAMIIVSTKN